MDFLIIFGKLEHKIAAIFEINRYCCRNYAFATEPLGGVQAFLFTRKYAIIILRKL